MTKKERIEKYRKETESMGISKDNINKPENNCVYCGKLSGNDDLCPECKENTK